MNSDSVASSAQQSFSLDYLGSITFHRAYATSMSRWLIGWVKIVNKSSPEHVCVTFDEEGIIAKKENRNLIDVGDCSLNSNGITIAETPLALSTSEESFGTEHIVKFSEIFEVIFPHDNEKFCLSIVANQGNESSLMLLVFHSNDVAMVSFMFDYFRVWYSKFQRNLKCILYSVESYI